MFGVKIVIWFGHVLHPAMLEQQHHAGGWVCAAVEVRLGHIRLLLPV
jgi:hypothetical protein